MKPLKTRILNFYDKWLHGVSIINHKMPVPKKTQLIERITQSLCLLPVNMIIGSFNSASVEIPDVSNAPVNPFISRPEFNNRLYDSDAKPNLDTLGENLIFG